MEKYEIGLFTTLLLGLFVLLGAIIAIFMDKNKKIIEFSLGLSFGVITALIITDLIPEIYETLGLQQIYIAIICLIIGYILLKVLDKFIPDHQNHEIKEEKSLDNLTHIGIITSVALILHNIIEGMAVYSSCLSNASLGVALTLGVGFHNIPLGMVIASSFYHTNRNLIKTFLIVLVVGLSTFVGGLIMYLFNLTEISTILLGVLLSLTMGMLLFIVINELIPRILATKNKKASYCGIITGLIILIIALFFGE